MMIVIEELRALHQDGARVILQCKQRLQLKGAAEKVVSALQNRVTNLLTGNDMAQLIEALKNEDLFTNKLSVQRVIQQHSVIGSKLVEQLRANIEDYQRRVVVQVRPHEIA